MGFSYTQNQEQPLNPTTASTLAAYRDELEGANFADDMVAHLVMAAARELVANGLTVKAAELDFGDNETGESKPTACGHDMPSIRELIQAVGDLSAMIPGVEPVGDSSWKILAPYYEDVWDRYIQSHLRRAPRETI